MWCGLFALLPMKKDNKKEINQYLIKRTRIIWFFLLCAFNFLGGKLLVELLRLQIKKAGLEKLPPQLTCHLAWRVLEKKYCLWILIRRAICQVDWGWTRKMLKIVFMT